MCRRNLPSPTSFLRWTCLAATCLRRGKPLLTKTFPNGRTSHNVHLRQLSLLGSRPSRITFHFQAAVHLGQLSIIGNRPSRTTFHYRQPPSRTTFHFQSTIHLGQLSIIGNRPSRTTFHFQATVHLGQLSILMQLPISDNFPL